MDELCVDGDMQLGKGGTGLGVQVQQVKERALLIWVGLRNKKGDDYLVENAI